MAGKAQLILVVGLSMILGMISLSLTRWSKAANESSSFYYEAMTSHNLAMAGAQVGICKAVQDTGWFGAEEYWEYTTGGSYAITRDLAEPLVLRSISSYQGINDMFHDTIEVYFSPVEFTSFTLFSWMTNDEGNVWWVTGDSVLGKLHTNGRLQVWGSPDFLDKVTAVRGFNDPPGKGTNQGHYKKGYETGVDSIYFPNNLAEIYTVAADSAGRYYDMPEIWVSLSGGNPGVDGDGMILVRATNGGPVIDSIPLNSSFNGVLMGDSIVHVQGTLDGQLTVASNYGDIYIEDNLLMEQDPLVNKKSNDLLGLVAENNIIVANNTANQTDVVVEASMFARNGSLTVQSLMDSTIGPRGRFTVVGSIVQDVRGPVGRTANGILTDGYYKTFVYDSRLFDPQVRPPVYPGYVPRSNPVIGWWESTRIPDYGKFGSL
jgi:hypothetical protein